MDRLAYVALSALSENSAPRQQLAHEIANISTVGFKRSFESATRAFQTVGPGFNTRILPTSADYDQISMTPGALMFSGNPLDVAMNDKTVMAVTGTNGDLAFTRRGDLRVTAAGTLENGAGHPVRGENGDITVPPGYVVNVTADGSVYAASPTAAQGSKQVLVGRIMLRDASKTPLQRREDGLFTPADNNPTKNKDITNGNVAPSLTIGSLEGSNVSSIGVMTKMIDSSRAFEANIRFIKEAKNIDEAGASMIKGS